MRRKGEIWAECSKAGRVTQTGGPDVTKPPAKGLSANPDDGPGYEETAETLARPGTTAKAQPRQIYSLATPVMVMWPMMESAVAPCQWFSPGRI